MKFGLGYDTETIGLPQWHEPSGGENQPHLVQLAAKLINLEDRSTTALMNTLIKPDGWEWDENNEAFKVHGITVEQCMDEGISEVEAVQIFFDLWKLGGDEVIRIGHNESFDRRLIRIATKRYPELAEFEEPWHDLAKDRSFCTMWKSINIVKAPKTMKQIKRGIRGKYKQPKLSEAYEHFVGEPLVGGHDAMIDVDACMQVYWGIKHWQEEAK